jgi:hypothetical protein
VTRNSFFNFVREVRRRLCGRPQTEIVQQAAKEWSAMSAQQKMQYQTMARTAKKEKRSPGKVVKSRAARYQRGRAKARKSHNATI